jgi:hypothetical protein
MEEFPIERIEHRSTTVMGHMTYCAAVVDAVKYALAQQSNTSFAVHHARGSSLILVT